MEVFNGTTPEVYSSIIERLSEQEVQNSRNGDTREIQSVIIHSDNPRERLLLRDNLNLAFGLQEAFAYWMGHNPGHVQRYNTQMKKYMYQKETENSQKLHGSAYGRYLRHLPHDQIQRVIDTLMESPNSRQAVINIHNAAYEDYDGPDVACTLSLQFFLRDNELSLITNMRSQDMLFGHPYDVHAFQWIQEVLAGILGVELGFYEHRMGSCHYYTDYEDKVLDSMRNYSAHEFDDIRTRPTVHQVLMNVLNAGLRKARNGEIPVTDIERLETDSVFYADWLKLMTAYEQHRFHDGYDRVFNLETEPFNEYLTRLLSTGDVH